MQKFKIFIYYVFIQHLPHSRFIGASNRIRIWYVSKILKIMPYDTKSKFEYKVYISDSKRLKIGNYVRINENVFLQGDISIGDHVMIAPNVSIYTKTHIHSDINTPMVCSGETKTKQVIIEDDVWLGINTTILPGVTIGKGSIIGANSLVNKSIPPYSIFGGVPAKFIKERT